MMKRILLSLFVFVFLLAGCVEVEGINSNTKNTQNPTILNGNAENLEEVKKEGFLKLENPTYVDGDTVKGYINGKKETVRILLVDTPETKHPTKGVQPFGKEASKFTEEFVLKNKNSLYVEYDVQDRDYYDRVLGYIWNETEMLNEALVLNGLARVGYIYESKKHLIRLQEAQKKAKAQKIGIWSLEGYVTDKGYNEDYEAPKSSQKSSSKQNNVSNGSIPDINGDGVCNDVKGNQGSSGWIYHVPGGSSYDKTNPEELFCTTSEAEKAGYRSASR